MAGGANLFICLCRATIEAAVRDILGSVMDVNQPLMEAGLDSLGKPALCLQLTCCTCGCCASRNSNEAVTCSMHRCCGAAECAEHSFRHRAASNRDHGLPHSRGIDRTSGKRVGTISDGNDRCLWNTTTTSIEGHTGLRHKVLQNDVPLHCRSQLPALYPVQWRPLLCTDSAFHGNVQARQPSSAWTAAPTAMPEAALPELLVCHASTLAGQTMAAGLHPHTFQLPAAQLASGPAPFVGMTYQARCDPCTKFIIWPDFVTILATAGQRGVLVG